MHYASIYIQPGFSEEVADFARRIFQKLGISRFEERGFPNQDTRSYYVGAAVGIEVAVGPSQREDYPFVVSIGLFGSSQSAEYLVEHAHILAYRWSREDWRCLVPKAESAFGHERKELVYAA